MMRLSFIVILSIAGALAPVHADLGVSEKGQELNKVQSEIKQLNKNIHQIRIKRNLLSKQLKKIEKQYGKTSGSLHELKVKIDKKKQRLQEIKKEIKQRQADAKLQNHELSGQIKAAYITGKKEKLKLLLNQQDPVLASRMMVYYQYLNEARLKKLAEIKENIETLEALENEQKQESLLLKRALTLRENEKVDLAKTKQQRERLLAKLNSDFTEKAQQLNELENNEKQLRQLITQLEKQAEERERLERQKRAQRLAEQQRQQEKIALAKKLQQENKKQPEGFLAQEPEDDKKTNSSLSKKESKPNKKLVVASKRKPKKTTFYPVSDQPFYKLKGKLPWPISGKLVKRFGSRRSDTRWDGVLIEAEEGTDIRAVSEGQVVFADWLRGYGLLVIIDHGKGYMTLYAFNQTLYKKVGDRVKSGTVIAAVGKSGGRTKSGLYFGVRKRGKAQNPVNWCRKVENGRVG